MEGKFQLPVREATGLTLQLVTGEDGDMVEVVKVWEVGKEEVWNTKVEERAEELPLRI